jgi:putative cardiolipin synthase
VAHRLGVTKAVSFLIAALCIAAAGCRALPARVAEASELALPVAQYGSLADFGRRVEAMLRNGESAHWLLDANQLALTARVALADEAAVSLDLQYFIWQSDATGHLLADRVLHAADRGVRVRILMDDFGVAGKGADVLKLDAHPNVEVRVFNPWSRRGSRFATATEFLTRAYELNRRMHNKTYIADGRFAVLGGRNIGDRYFGVYEPFVQNDLDVMVAGPAAREVAATFDAYWNSEHSYRIASFVRDERPHRPLDETRAELHATIETRAAALAPFTLEPGDWSPYLEELVATFVPARASLLWESPEIWNEARPRLYDSFVELVASARKEVLISSPYFIPDARFRRLLRELVARGVRVVVVTNSLATNNHVVAHTGYRRWRRDVLAAGVELYELRSDAEALSLYVTPPASSGRLGLHTKAVIVDGERAFVGSPNVDPRSMVLNTEIGLVGDGVELARRVGALVERDISPANAWRVTMDEKGWLEWSSADEVVRRQPAQGFKQRAAEFLLNLLPLKHQA